MAMDDNCKELALLFREMNECETVVFLKFLNIHTCNILVCIVDNKVSNRNRQRGVDSSFVL